MPIPSSENVSQVVEVPVKRRAPPKTWKSEERRVAKMLGSKRTPLSGQNSGHTGSDVLPQGAGEQWFVEVKHKKKMPFWKVFEKAKVGAKKEKKTPIIVLHQTGSHDRMVLMSFKDILQLLKDAGYVGEEE